MTKTVAKPTSMLKYQYDTILDQLILLQLHAENPNCPCSLTGDKQGELGEYCEPKHVRAIVALARETIPMETDKAKLAYLNKIDESGTQILEVMEGILCGKKNKSADWLAWARDMRKPLEDMTYSSFCKLSDSNLEEIAKLFSKEGAVMSHSDKARSIESLLRYDIRLDPMCLACREKTMRSIAKRYAGLTLVELEKEDKEKRTKVYEQDKQIQRVALQSLGRKVPAWLKDTNNNVADLAKLFGKNGSDIWFRGNYLGSIGNKVLRDEIRDALKELRNTVAHRRGIILGYRLVGFDSMKTEGSITETERKAASRMLQHGYDVLARPKTWSPATVYDNLTKLFEKGDLGIRQTYGGRPVFVIEGKRFYAVSKHRTQNRAQTALEKIDFPKNSRILHRGKWWFVVQIVPAQYQKVKLRDVTKPFERSIPMSDVIYGDRRVYRVDTGVKGQPSHKVEIQRLVVQAREPICDALERHYSKFNSHARAYYQGYNSKIKAHHYHIYPADKSWGVADLFVYLIEGEEVSDIKLFERRGEMGENGTISIMRREYKDKPLSRLISDIGLHAGLFERDPKFARIYEKELIAMVKVAREKTEGRLSDTPDQAEMGAKHGLAISGYVRDLANNECLQDYNKAVKFSEKFDRMVVKADWLSTYDGTTFEKTFVPKKGKFDDLAKLFEPAELGDRIYRWVKGTNQYNKLKSELEKRGWEHYLDHTRQSDAFRSAKEQKGIAIGRRKEHPKGFDTYTVFRRKSRLSDDTEFTDAQVDELLQLASPDKCKLVRDFYHCEIKPKRYFDPRSFRTVTPREGVRITTGCPKGQYSPSKQRCKVGTEAQRIMYEKGVARPKLSAQEEKEVDEVVRAIAKAEVIE